MVKKNDDNIHLQIQTNLNQRITFESFEDYRNYLTENSIINPVEVIEPDNNCRIFIKIIIKKEEIPEMFEENQNNAKKFFAIFIKEFICKLIFTCNLQTEDNVSTNEITNDSFIINILVKNKYIPNRYATVGIIKNVFEKIYRGFSCMYSYFDIMQYYRTTYKNIDNLDCTVSAAKHDTPIEQENTNCRVLGEEDIEFLDMFTFSEEKQEKFGKILDEEHEFKEYRRGYYVFEKNDDDFCRTCKKKCKNSEILVYEDINYNIQKMCTKDTTKRELLFKNNQEKIKNIIEMDNFDVIEKEVYSDNYMRDYDFKKDTVLVKASMGRGKTEKLIKTLKDVFKDKKSKYKVLFITHRIAQTYDVKSRLQDHFKVSTYREKYNFSETQVLIIQLESIYKIKNIVNFDKTILILDEMESILSEMDCELGKEKKSVKRMFEALVKHSKKVFVMDAFLGFRTYEYLKICRDFNNSVLYINTKTDAKYSYLYEREENFVSEFKSTVNKIVDNRKLVKELKKYTQSDERYTKIMESLHFIEKKNQEEKLLEKIVVVSNSKTEAKFLIEVINEICEEKGETLDILFIHGDADIEKETLLNVNENWSECDILVYTPAIVAACSYTERDNFDVMFGFFTSESVDYKSSCQMINRVRDISSNEYHLFLKEGKIYQSMTFGDIEEALSLNEELIKTTFKDIPDTYSNLDENGRITYPFKDINYNTFVNNKVFLSQSRAHFKDLFFNCIKESGFKIIMIENQSLDEENDKEIRKDKKRKIKEIKEKENKEIANAADLTLEEKLEIEKKRNENIQITKEERLSLQKNYLKTLYNIEYYDINEKFVKEYNKIEKQNIYKSWISLNNHRLERIDVTESMDDIYMGSTKPIKREIAQRIIKNLTGRNLHDCIGQVFLIQNMKKKIDLVYKDMCLKKKQIMFNFMKNFKGDPNTTDRSKVIVINKILNQTYGITLKNIGINYKVVLDSSFVIENNVIKVKNK